MHVLKSDIMKFNADLRKRFQQGFFNYHSSLDIGELSERIDLPKGLRFSYYLTSEYGPTGGQPHYHSVYYNLPEDRYLVEILFETIWNKGFVRVYKASDRTISYITKYLVNSKVCDTYDPRFQERPFSLMSKKLGLSYADRMGDYHRADPLHRQSMVYHGEHSQMSRYIRDKIFSEEDRALLAEQNRKRLEAIDARYESLPSEQAAKIRTERENWQKSQEYAAEWIALKKHKL